MIVWEAPGPYRVGFTTRQGGVSSDEFASLNLGGIGDDPAAIAENRRRACTALGLDHERLAVNHQCRGTVINRARPGGVGEDGDGLWTDEPGLPLLVLSADCLPIAVVSTADTPALAVIHAGWRGLAAGVIEAAVAGLSRARTAAIIGPSIGPCCYEVGTDVSARFAPDLTRKNRLNLWEAATRSLRAAGVEQVECLEICTHCDSQYFSHRRSQTDRHGRQGVIGALER